MIKHSYQDEHPGSARLPYPDALRGFGILFVVAIHAFGYLRFQVDGAWQVPWLIVSLNGEAYQNQDLRGRGPSMLYGTTRAIARSPQSTNRDTPSGRIRRRICCFGVELCESGSSAVSSTIDTFHGHMSRLPFRISYG